MQQAHIDAGICVDVASLVAIGSQAGFNHARLLKNARAILAGAHLSAFRGRGMDFAESREYQPGDDRRHIDWRVTARTGKTHTKLFTEERERPVFLLVDMSASMFFGTQGGFKTVTAARLAAYLAWSTIGAGDRVGGVVAKTGTFADLRPAAGRRGALKIISALSDATELDKSTSQNSEPQLNPLLEQAGRLIHPGSQIFLISDFYHIDSTTQKLLSRLVRHNDLMCCQVVDQLESRPPQPGRYRFTDGKNSNSVSLVEKAGRRYYRSVFDQRCERLQDLGRAFAAPIVRLSAGDAFEQVFAINPGKSVSAAEL